MGTFVTILGAFLVLAFLFDRIFLKEKKATFKEYIMAKRLFEKKEPFSNEMLDHGLSLLKKYPELSAQYQGALSLALAQSENTEESISVLKNHLKRVEKLCPSEYQEFASTQILITEKNYDEAFKQALNLEEKIKDSPIHTRLRTVNLIRIAFLAHEKKEEFIKNETLIKLQKSPLYPVVESLFSEENFNLTTYLVNTNWH